MSRILILVGNGHSLTLRLTIPLPYTPGLLFSSCPRNSIEILDSLGKLPIRNPHLSRLILFGEGTLRQVLKEYDIPYHQEGNHQGRENEVLMPLATQEDLETESIRSWERLGGLLKYSHREGA